MTDRPTVPDRATIAGQLIALLAAMPNTAPHSENVKASAALTNEILAVFMGWQKVTVDRGGVDGLIASPWAYWISPAGTETGGVPDYLSSLEDALALTPEGWSVALYLNPTGLNYCHLSPPKGSAWINIQGGSTLPAVAICIAAVRAKLFLEAPVRRKVGR